MPNGSDVKDAVRRWAPDVKNVLRTVRARLTGTAQADRFMTTISKSVLSYTPSRSQCVEHIIAFVVDAAQRGNLEDAEFIGRELVAIARAEWDRVHPASQLSLRELHLNEQHLEGKFNDAQMALVHDRSSSTLARFYATGAAYQAAIDRVIAAEHRFDREVAR